MKNTELIVRERSREGLDRVKLRQALWSFAGGARKADAYLDHFSHIDTRLLEELAAVRQGLHRPIKGLVIDLDATLAPAYCAIPEVNLTALDRLADKGIKLAVYSNALSTVNAERLKALSSRKIPFFTQPIAKPHPQGFRTVCKEFGLDHRTTWMVGDDPATDGGALNTHPDDGEPVLGGMIFIKPIPDQAGVITGTKRLTLGIKSAARAFSLFATTYRNPRIITSRDLDNARSR